MITPPLSDQHCADLFKALADPTRLKLLHCLAEEAKCVSDLQADLKLSQSLLSHHLKVLRTSGLVEASRDGQKMCYALHPQVRDRLSQAKQETLNLGCCEVKFRS